MAKKKKLSSKAKIGSATSGSRQTKKQARDAKYNALVKEYRKLAKRADQRLVRLERYAQQDKYKNVKKYAYARAMRDIRSWSGSKEGANRFNIKPPSNINSLMGRINDIKTFLHSASSSIKPTMDNAVYNSEGQLIGGGIDLTYQKRAATLNERYGTDVTWENIGQLFESQLFRKLDKKYKSSKTAVRIIGKLQKDEKSIIKAFDDKKSFNVRIEGEKPLEEAVNKTLRYYKKDINSLFGAL